MKVFIYLAVFLFGVTVGLAAYEVNSAFTQADRIPTYKSSTASLSADKQKEIQRDADKYILAYENYDYQTVEVDRQTVRLMSMPDVWRTYMQSLENRMHDYATHTTRTLTYKSSEVKIDDTTHDALIEAVYLVTERKPQRRPVEYNLNVRLVCHFDESANLNSDQLKINPDKFVVTSYNSNKEVYTSNQ